MLRRTVLKLAFMTAIGTPLSGSAQERDKLYVETQIATRMVENGKTDGDRLFTFYFTYLPEGYCSVHLPH